MKVIYSNIIPFRGFLAVNICGLLFVRKNLKDKMTTSAYNHEAIHSKQWIEMLVVGFLVWYVAEWLIRVLFSKDRFTHKAYRNISLEREAYEHEDDLDYTVSRKKYSFIKYI